LILEIREIYALVEGFGHEILKERAREKPVVRVLGR